MPGTSGAEHPTTGTPPSPASGAVVSAPPLRIAPDTYSRNWWIARACGAVFRPGETFSALDVVDGTDPSLVNLEAADVRAAGGDPIVVFGMSNGIEVVTNQIVARGRNQNVMLLRFHGHGNQGLQNVTGGEINGAPHLAAISLSNFAQVEGTIRRIRPVMLPFGSIQLLGCDVGGGRGSQLVARLATTWGVPVTAGLHTQFGGGNRTFRFEGPTVTGFPFGNLKTWSQQMEDQFGNQSMAT